MLSPVAVAGCAINLVIASVCLFVRYCRAGRDWLVPMGASHVLAFVAYGILIPFPPGPSLNAVLASPLGLLIALISAGVLGCIFGGTMHLRYGAPIWRLTAAFGTAFGFAVMISAFLFDYRATMLAYTIGLCLTAPICGAALLAGPTAFYRLAGLSLIARGAMTGSLAMLAGTVDNEAIFTALGVLNVIFIAATGFGLILIELDDARQRALEADLAKSQFVANMSHELRTPLNAILGFAEILEGRAFSPSQQQTSSYAGLISQAGRHLLGIINTLLDMAAIEARREKLNLEPVHLDEVVSSSIDLLIAEAARKQVAIEFESAGPVEIVSDARALRQVLLNLLGNAIKFSPTEGVVNIRLAITGNGKLHLSVADRGSGISASEVKHIFKPFWQAGDTYSRSHGGVGLGLAIAQRLAGALGGSIAVESRKGEGSTFTIILPLSSADKVSVVQTRAI